MILVGNSMGGLASILLAARRPDLVAGLVLIDPALPLPRGVRPDIAVAAVFARFALPWVGRYALAQGRRKRSARDQVRQLLALCCVDPSRVPDDLVAASAELVPGWTVRARSRRGARRRVENSAEPLTLKGILLSSH